jgi:putative hydrolase of the HAD superfamily
MVSLVFFDAVGTLLYPEPPVGEIYSAAGRRWGAALGAAEIESRFRAAFARQELFDRDQGYRTDEARERRRWQTIVAEVFHDQAHPHGPFEDLWRHFSQPHAWQCYRDVAPCLDWLTDRGIRWGMASNYDGRLRTVAAGIRSLRTCSQWAISSEMGWRKPAPQFFEGLIAMSDVPADRLVYVGDDEENDWRGAAAAGLATLLLNRDLVGRPFQPNRHCIASLDDLPARLEEIGVLT